MGARNDAGGVGVVSLHGVHGAYASGRLEQEQGQGHAWVAGSGGRQRVGA